jgi:hypothetical protein
MHKNIWNPDQIHAVIKGVLDHVSIGFVQENTKLDENALPVIERKNIKELIEKKVESLSKVMPYKYEVIKLRLLSDIKKNRVAMRYEMACERHIKSFSVESFLMCEICDSRKDNLNWSFCESCGTFNKYKIN